MKHIFNKLKPTIGVSSQIIASEADFSAPYMSAIGVSSTYNV